MAKNELPTRGNKRGGAGWWMDEDGLWRSPNEWPEDTPPLDGWVRNSDGRWRASGSGTTSGSDAVHRPQRPVGSGSSTGSDVDAKPSRASSDRKAVLAVAGIIAGALALLGGALLLITQAAAEDFPEEVAAEPEVIFAAETEVARHERRAGVAADAPLVARGQLVQLEVRSVEGSLDDFNPFDWQAVRTDCLDIAEQVLVARTQAPIVWADQLQCVPDKGKWSDRYLDTTITRTLDAEVSVHVPAAVAFVSGGSQWSVDTRQSYLTDVEHPATLSITRVGSGHNPRGLDPSQWKPAAQSEWCAYAIDWIAVKNRWELSVTKPEVDALTEMLTSCEEQGSSGPDLITMVIDPIAEPSIERNDEFGE